MLAPVSRHGLLRRAALPGLAVAALVVAACMPRHTPEPEASAPQARICTPANTVYAEVVALEQVYYWNRFGSFNPGGMMFALRHDVATAQDDDDGAEEADAAGKGKAAKAASSAQPLAPGKVRLRDGKRPRPLVLRVAEGQCLQVEFQNLLAPVREDDIQRAAPAYQVDPQGLAAYEGKTEAAKRAITKDKSKIPDSKQNFSADLPRTRYASLHANGLSYLPTDAGYRAECKRVGAKACGSDGAHVGANESTLVAPGEKAVYRWYAEKEGAYFFYSGGAPVGGEGDGGQLGLGLFGSVNVEPKGSSWYRSQVTHQDMQAAKLALAAGKTHPYSNLDYSKFSLLETRKIKGELRNYLRHSDLNAIVVMPHDPAFVDAYPEDKDGESRSHCNDKTYSGSCGRSFREFTAIFHDEIQAVQAFPEYADEANPISGLKDGMAINYGSAGMGAMLGARARRIAPLQDCVECRAEEFFLSSWAVGDPALLLQRDADGKAVGTLYPDDPSNVHHSYMGDAIRFRNLHAGPKETHVFHLHAHQWLQDKEDTEGTYLDSQTISPGATFSYGIEWGGSGNRNSLVGDSIFHCHLYPHFAQGMWELWRSHDVFEDGHNGVYDAQKNPQGRAYPDAELSAGVDTPALVPLPGAALAIMPDQHFGGYPFYIPAKAGHRPPQPPLDLDVATGADGKKEEINGGLPRHIVLDGLLSGDFKNEADKQKAAQERAQAIEEGLRKGGPIAEVNAKRVLSQNGNPVLTTFAQEWEQIQLKLVDESGESAEKRAMQFHAGNGQSFIPGIQAKKWGNGYGWATTGYKTDLSGTAGTGKAPRNAVNPGYFAVNGLPPKPGAPYADPCPANTDDGAQGDKLLREYRAVYLQGDLVVNKYGWHDPQARMILLEDDLKDTVLSPYSLNGRRPAEPFFFRANSGDCVVFKATNLIPNALNLDDFQIFTPTDTIGQHIHLVKFDVTSSDGSGNGWNYEDATFSPDEIRERLHACNETPACLQAIKQSRPQLLGADGKLHPRTHPMFRKTGTKLPEDIAKLGRCKDEGGTDDDPIGHPWCGAQTTVQRWWADPLFNGKPGGEKSHDRTIRTVFTHDHMGPSSHQHHGFYAALVVEPKNSVWEFQDGRALGGADLKKAPAIAFPNPNANGWTTGGELPPAKVCQSNTDFTKFDFAVNGVCPSGMGLRKDGGPTSYAANVVAPVFRNDPFSNPRAPGANEAAMSAKLKQAEVAARATAKQRAQQYGWDAQREEQEFQELMQAQNGLPDTRREFNMAFADFAIVYTQDLQPVNPPNRDQTALFNGDARPFAQPKPEAISAGDPGTQLINYRNEPVPLRISKAKQKDADDCALLSGEREQKAGESGDLAFVFDSRTHKDCGKALASTRTNPRVHPFIAERKLKLHAGTDLNAIAKKLEKERQQFLANLTKFEPWRTDGDPATPLLPAFEGDALQLRLVQGAQEEQHVFTMDGVKWLSVPSAQRSGYVNAQQIGISEHMEFVADVPPDGNTPRSDYLYQSSATDNLWDGMWGLLRVQKKNNDSGAQIRPLLSADLLPKPAKPRAGDADEICPPQTTVPGSPLLKTFRISAWPACEVLGNCAGAMPGIVYNERFGLSDPYAVMYIEEPEEFRPLNRAAKLAKLRQIYATGKKVDPLILRVPAGACMRVALFNYLDASSPEAQIFNRDDPRSPQRHALSFSHDLLPAIVDGFNVNQLRTSRHVNLRPQLLAAAAFCQSSRVGLNGILESKTPGAEPDVDARNSYVPAGENHSYYKWYAGDHKYDAQGNALELPVEFGVVTLSDRGDTILRPSHSAVGAV